jgi:hypothetical protein
MLEIDKYDVELQDYFSWSEEEKQFITMSILNLLDPILVSDKFMRETLAMAFLSCIQSSIEMEEYEQADIMDRCLKELQKKL